MAASETQDEDIRKFEEIGTHPAANHQAISEALTFHEGIGGARKGARLRYLLNYWAEPLLKDDRVVLHTSQNPEFGCGIGVVQIKGMDSGAIGEFMWDKHRIIITPIKHSEFEGLRITPNVYTTLEEVDRFIEAMQFLLENGLPEKYL